jgi:hypothetical protein
VVVEAETAEYRAALQTVLLVAQVEVVHFLRKQVVLEHQDKATLVGLQQQVMGLAEEVLVLRVARVL